ncbi:hypothetical protein Asal01_00471 [Fodinibius salicampi]
MINSTLLHKEKVLFLVGLLFLICTLGPIPATAQLPQDHGYQGELRNYIGSLSEGDFELDLSPLTVETSYFDTDAEIYQSWLVFGHDASEFPPADGIRVGSDYFTLDAIESGGSVHMTIGRGGWISALATAFFADWNYEGNPHYDSRAVKLRAFVAASVDMMMQDQAHDEGNGDRSDFLGGQLIQWAYAYGVAKDELPESAKAAFEEGLIRMFEKLESWGPTGTHADMDTRAIPGVLYVARHVESQDLTQRAYDYIDRVLDSHFRPAGYIDHGGAYDASYNGISLFHLNWGAYLSEYSPIVEALQQMTKLKAHLTFLDPDGDHNTPHHSNSSSAGDAAEDQWMRHFRNAGLAYWSDEGMALLGEDNIADASTMISDMNFRSDFLNSSDGQEDFDDPDSSTPGEWERRHWTVTNFNYTSLYYREDHYDRLRSATQRELTLPFERGEKFIESFDDKFLSTRQKGYGTVLFNDRLSWWTSEGQTEELNGFGGGNISAFWTPATGTVLMGVARGTRHGGHDLQDWPMWPVHALSGQTTGGAAFSSALQRHPEASYALNQDLPTVTVSGDLSNEWSDPTGGISGQASYQREFTIGEEELYVTTSVNGDSGTEVEELYEILPVFRRNASDQSSDTQTQIAFEVDGSWEPAGTDMKTVTRIRLQRFEGTVMIEFASPARVKLSSEDFYINPSSQSGAQVRNILIDLLGSGGPAPLGGQAIEYRIYNAGPKKELSGSQNGRFIQNPPLLKQNYPNPFTGNSSTTIEFEMPDTQEASLKVYDITGRLIATLANGVIEDGSHTEVFNADGLALASGIYFYSLTTENAILTRKMTYLK